MVAQNIFFGIIAVIMIFAALRVVTTRNVVHAALFLMVVLAGVAAQFILLGGEFVAATQVLVYIGAVIVLFLFGVMLTRASLGGEEDADVPNRLPALVTAGILLLVLAFTLIDSFEDVELPKERRTTTAEVSDSIFSDYIIPFEAISVLLLAALIGAIVVARKE